MNEIAHNWPATDADWANQCRDMISDLNEFIREAHKRAGITIRLSAPDDKQATMKQYHPTIIKRL